MRNANKVASTSKALVKAPAPPFTYLIEDNVPIPGRWRDRDRVSKFQTMHKLKVGQSFFVPVTDKEEARKIARGARVAANAVLRKNNKRFTVRTIEEDNNVIGVRIWRI